MRQHVSLPLDAVYTQGDLYAQQDSYAQHDIYGRHDIYAQGENPIRGILVGLALIAPFWAAAVIWAVLH